MAHHKLSHDWEGQGDAPGTSMPRRQRVPAPPPPGALTRVGDAIFSVVGGIFFRIINVVNWSRLCRGLLRLPGIGALARLHPDTIAAIVGALLGLAILGLLHSLKKTRSRGAHESSMEKTAAESAEFEGVEQRAGSQGLHVPPRKRSNSVAGKGAAGKRGSILEVLTGATHTPTSAGTPTDVDMAERSERRSSIFDRIADAFFNEEQLRGTPVDAEAVRAGLEEEFEVTFREGSMGVTLSMDQCKNAKVGKVVPHGQAYRAGVYPDDRVVAVGEHEASSYGTVLAFMNIVGRPVTLRFRKADMYGYSGAPMAMNKRGRASSLSLNLADSTHSERDGSSIHSVGGLGGSRRINRGPSLTRMGSFARVFKGDGGAPQSPIMTPRDLSAVGVAGTDVAGHDAGFKSKMEQGVLVTKYSRKGAPAQRVLFVDLEAKAVAWRDLASNSPTHKRSPSFTNLLKAQRETLSLRTLQQVRAGDERDPERPGECGSALLRAHCDKTLLARSFVLVFSERSLEVTCSSREEMHQLVQGFRALQAKYHGGG